MRSHEDHQIVAQPDDDDLLPSSDAAKELGLSSAHTLDVWRSTKRYPELEYLKIGRLVRYRRGAIRRFKALCAVGGQADV